MGRNWKRVADAAGLRLVTPAPAVSAVDQAERVLGAKFSSSLRDLYAYSDGLIDEWGYAYVLPLAELTQQNQHFRAEFHDLYMPFDDLTLFGQRGNGDMLFQPNVPLKNENVFVWDHEDDSRTWYAQDAEAAILRLAGAETS